MKKGLSDNMTAVLLAAIFAVVFIALMYFAFKSEGQQLESKQTTSKVLSSKVSPDIQSLHKYEGSIVVDKKETNANKSADQPHKYYVTIYHKPPRVHGLPEPEPKTIKVRVSKYEYGLFQCGDHISF